MHWAFMNYLGHVPFRSRYCRLYTLVAHCSVHVVENIFYIYFAVAAHIKDPDYIGHFIMLVRVYRTSQLHMYDIYLLLVDMVGACCNCLTHKET